MKSYPSCYHLSFFFCLFVCLEHFSNSKSKSAVKNLTSKALLPLHSFVGDTVCMTLFLVLILARLLPSWPTPLTHLWVPISASQANTHCQSFFLSKGQEHSPRTDISNQPTSFLFLLPDVPLHMAHFGLSSDGTQREGNERVCDKNWSCLWCWPTAGDAGCSDVHVQRVGLRMDWTMIII